MAVSLRPPPGLTRTCPGPTEGEGTFSGEGQGPGVRREPQLPPVASACSLCLLLCGVQCTAYDY